MPLDMASWPEQFDLVGYVTLFWEKMGLSEFGELT